MKTIEAAVRVKVQISTDADQPDKELRDAARQAIENAVKFGEVVGFEHRLAAEASVGVCGVELEPWPGKRN